MLRAQHLFPYDTILEQPVSLPEDWFHTAPALRSPIPLSFLGCTALSSVQCTKYHNATCRSLIQGCQYLRTDLGTPSSVQLHPYSVLCIAGGFHVAEDPNHGFFCFASMPQKMNRAISRC